MNLVVVDEGRRPVAGAEVRLQNTTGETDESGVARLSLVGPDAGVVVAAGFLAEPITVGREDRRIEVRLWAEADASGSRRAALHFAGDTMLGRRYLEPGRPDTAVVDPAGPASSRDVVSAVAPLFAAADHSSVNLETVIGSRPMREAAAGKRFLLQSPRSVVDALEALGVDVVSLGNNHVNDWGAPGLAETIGALEAAGLATVGAGSDSVVARQPVLRDAAGMTVASISYTTVTGDFVNDHLPLSGEVQPDGLQPGDYWQYEVRRFSHGSPGGSAYVPETVMTAGDAWEWFSQVEAELDESSAARLWTALTAASAFPELQDWVARRGHGGAARFRRTAAEEDVAAAREAGADFVVVQIHGGYQFSSSASAFFRSAAHAAIEAGADLVVGHHPHVLQGFEWYRGRLIAHSMGNFVFDQDFLVTFPSGFLRLVVDESGLLEARLIPLVLDRYRPVPVTGAAASRIFGAARAASLTPGSANRLADGTVGVVLGERAGAAWVDESGRIGVLPSHRDQAVVFAPDGMADLPSGVVRLPSNSSVSWIGRDLLGWGWIDDTEADGFLGGAAMWSLPSAEQTAVVATDPAAGDLALLLSSSQDEGAARIRPVARVPLRGNALYDEAEEPADGKPWYSVRLAVKSDTDTTLTVRFDAYHFDDTHPLRDPVSDRVRRVEVPMPISRSAEWQRIDVPIPPGAYAPAADLPITAIMLYLVVSESTPAGVLVDDVTFLEWRPADLAWGRWTTADVLRGEPGESVTVTTGRIGG